MKLDIKLIGYINLFENKTGVPVKDCFMDRNDNLVFVVKQGFGSKAVGKEGVMIKRLRNLFKKKIRIIEFNDNPLIFVKNIIYPLKPIEIILKENNIVIKAENTQQRGLLIGRDKQNLISLKSILNKFYNYDVLIE